MSLATLTTHLQQTFDPAAVREYAFERYLEITDLPHEPYCFSQVFGSVSGCSCRKRAVLEAARERYRAAYAVRP